MDEGSRRDAAGGAPVGGVQLESGERELAAIKRALDEVEPPLHSDDEVAAWARDVLAAQRDVLRGLAR